MEGRLTARNRRVAGAVVVVAALAVAAFGAVGYASPTGSAAQQQYAPQNTAAPTISGAARVGETLTASTGGFTGDQPITYTFRWQRCAANGTGCVDIAGASAQKYVVQAADDAHTLRVVVTAQNTSGSNAATSVPTAAVTTPGPAGQIRLPGGGISIPATSVALPERLIVDHVGFSPNPVRSLATTIQIRVRVRDTRGYFIRGALVFVRSTPLLTSTAPEQATQTNGTVTLLERPRAGFPTRNGYFVQFFVRARRAGENILAGVSTRRLVQLRTANPR